MRNFWKIEVREQEGEGGGEGCGQQKE